MSQTPSRQYVFDSVLDKISEFKSLNDWIEFDIEQYLIDMNCSGVDRFLITDCYMNHIEYMRDCESKNKLPEDLFEI